MRDSFGKSLSRPRSASFRAVPVLIALMQFTILGCQDGEPRSDSSSHIATTVTPTATRDARRAYDGAPPVIPHPPLGAACVSCHTDSGRSAPPVGYAPPNPHLATRGIGKTANCRQCHVFVRANTQFVANSFSPFIQQPRSADKAVPGAPPVIPHSVFMRETCLACHDGPAARPEIRTSHPDRTNCRQCHMSQATTGDFDGQRSATTDR